MNHSTLLVTHLETLQKLSKQAPVLDLACGSGRNGLFLSQNNIPVVFADVKESAIEQVKQSLPSTTPFDSSVVKGLASAQVWQVDFERETNLALNKKEFAAILVFRYLHRPLFEHIKRSVISGGMVIYETFTVDQPQYGRPKRAEFLLNHGELAKQFSDWKIIHLFEGVVSADNESGQQAIAQIVAIKP